MTVEPTSSAELLSGLHALCFDRPWDVGAFEDILEMPGTRAFVISDGDNPSGFAVLRQAADEAEIITIGIRPESRRNGLARTLLARSVEAIPDCRTLILEVSERNDPARAFYETLGFSVAGRRRRYYADGADALVMIVALPFPCG